MSLAVAPRVAAAMAAGQPVVALESTIIAHGFPRPRNLEVALEMEAAVAAEGAVPATIGVIDGVLTVGLDGEALQQIANDDVAKVNAANLAVCVAQGRSGATTVSATLRAARLAEIRIVATGGIGGVHRGGTTDVSADLPELAAGQIGVVSSGAKAFLDLEATLAYLETAGVTVVGYRTDEFPAFYSRHSGLSLPHRVDSPIEAADVLAAAIRLDGGGVLFANPIADEHALDGAEVERWTEKARADADAAGITGTGRTPFILGRIAEISEGRSVEANFALAMGNARLAAQIASAR